MALEAFQSWSAFVGQAEALGIRVRLVCGVEERTLRGAIELTTSDPEAHVILRLLDEAPGGGLSLNAREQFAPDSWSLPFALSACGTRVGAELELGDRKAFVPFASVGAAILSENGWTDDSSLLAELHLSRAAIREAFEVLDVGA